MYSNHRSRQAFIRVYIILAVAALLVGGLTTGGSADANDQSNITAELFTSGFTSGPMRQLTLKSVIAGAGATGHEKLHLGIAIKNVGNNVLHISNSEFYLSAQGDSLAHIINRSGATAGADINPGEEVAGDIEFDIPVATIPYITLVDQPTTGGAPLTIPVGKGSSTGSSVVGASLPATSALTTTTNTIEDNFQRPNQAGWGTSTNASGVANVTWGMDGANTSYTTINNNTGAYNYPGNPNTIGIAAAGSATYNGGDALVEFSLSAVGHVTPYVSLNDCANKSCYYGARVHTSQNLLEIAKRSGGSTKILTSVPFTASANTQYWLRLDVAPGPTSTVLQAKIWSAGSAEPTAWMLSATDTTPLAANLAGTGGSWDNVGTGESINYTCYAFAMSGLATACGSAGPTPTPTPTNTPTPGPTPTATPTPAPTATPAPLTVTTYSLNGGVGDPWGTATDAQGNVWFAEPGCDFAPTCSSTAGPGQIGVLRVGATSPQFWTLPNISGNQPIFVALDSSGNVWFTTPNNSMIGEFSPSTNTFVGQWAVTAGSGPWDLTFNHGVIWYSEHLASAVGRFDPVAHTFQDFQTPSAGSNPYGIAGIDPINANLVWFAENKDSVNKIGVIDVSTDTITEYSIRAQAQSGLTPHKLVVDSQGNVWWSEGWVRAVGELIPSAANPSNCGSSSGDCVGVKEFSIGASTSACSGTHISGIALNGSSATVWFSDSLAGQVGYVTTASSGITTVQLSPCGAHPHDGLNPDTLNHIWWDEEFNNALGELTA